MELRPRALEVLVEEIVVSGVDVSDEASFAAALRSHLEHSLARDGLAPEPGGRATSRIDAGAIRVARGAGAAELGSQVARAVSGAIETAAVTSR